MKRLAMVVGALGVLAGCAAPQGTLNFLGDAPLSAEAQSEVRKMQRDGHYGAMATDPSGAWGWSAGYNSLEAARADALALCNTGVLSGADCEIVLELVPQGPPVLVEGETLSATALPAFQRHSTRKGASAFVVTADGTYGHGWGYDTVQDATERAMMECTKRNTDRDDLPVYPCEVIWTKSAPIQ